MFLCISLKSGINISGKTAGILIKGGIFMFTISSHQIDIKYLI